MVRVRVSVRVRVRVMVMVMVKGRVRVRFMVEFVCYVLSVCCGTGWHRHLSWPIGTSYTLALTLTLTLTLYPLTKAPTIRPRKF